MTSYHKLLAIGVACIAIATPLTNLSLTASERAKATAWGQCFEHHAATDCDEYAPDR